MGLRASLNAETALLGALLSINTLWGTPHYSPFPEYRRKHTDRAVALLKEVLAYIETGDSFDVACVAEQAKKIILAGGQYSAAGDD